MHKKSKNMQFLSLLCYIISLQMIPNIIIILENIYNKSIIFFIIVHNILALIIYILIYLCRINRGIVPQDEHLKILLGRECRKCKNYKPERAHHCSKCNFCIKRMDHHCRWLGVCINSDNLAYFIRMLFFGLLAHLHIVILCIRMLHIEIIDLNFTMTYYILCTFTLLGFFGLLIFFTYQIYGVIKNQTFIEQERYKDLIRYGVICPKSPYDLGVYRNLRVLLGYPFLLYMYGSKDNGLVFEKTYNCDDWPPFRLRGNGWEYELV